MHSAGCPPRIGVNRFEITAAAEESIARFAVSNGRPISIKFSFFAEIRDERASRILVITKAKDFKVVINYDRRHGISEGNIPN